MKYRVLLVDDNQIALESMERTVPWEELGLTLVGCAADGIEGCEKIAALQPDIVISDIHMPGMDGLAMMEKMNQQLSASRVIFITAYEKIEYASRAIRLSAFDFLLKPVDNQELIKSVQRAIASLDEERNVQETYNRTQTILRRTRFLSALTAGAAMDGAQSVFSSVLSQPPKGYFFVVAEPEKGITEPVQRLEFLKFPENVEVVNAVINRQMVLLCGLRQEEGAWQTTARTVANILQQNFFDLTVAISDLYQDPAAFYSAYQEARCTLLRHDVYGRKVTIEFAGEQKSDAQRRSRLVDLEHACEKLAHRIGSIDAVELWETILKKSNGNLRIIRTILMLLCTKVMQNQIENHLWTESADMVVYDITKLNSYQDARNWLLRFMEEVHSGEQLPNRHSTLVRNVLEYVRSHITEGLVLEDVAKEFFVSPNYLSSLIHKETGITYRQHIIDAKITVAKQMLDDTRMRVEDIAYAVGYENYVSFYNVFKKAEHMSPTEYRFQHWKGDQEPVV